MLREVELSCIRSCRSVVGVIKQLVDIFISQGRMVSPDEGMCLVQVSILGTVLLA